MKAARTKAITWGLELLTVRVASALQKRGIPFLVLRGPVLANWLYDDPFERSYIDVDLLVPPAHRTEALAALRELGLEPVFAGAAPTEREPHAETFLDPARRAVDLHWTVKGVGADPVEVWATLSNDPEELELQGIQMAIPAEPVRALIVALHAAQHADQHAVALEDVARAVNRVEFPVWQEAAQLAAELDASAAFAAGIRLAAGGEGLVERLGVAAGPTLDIAIRAQGNVPVLRGLRRLREAPGVAPKLRLLARELFPTPAFMRLTSPLAHRGGLGLAAAYAIRPFWIIWHLPAAYRAYRRAVRAGSCRQVP